MQLEQLDLPGGGLLTVYLRDCVETMPQAMDCLLYTSPSPRDRG